MKYASVDIETTGVDWLKCQVLEIGAVLEDTNNPVPLAELPSFRILIKWETLYWEETAREMHLNLMNQFKQPVPGLTICRPDEAGILFKHFLLMNGYQDNPDGGVRVVPAGKNFAGFDRQFLDLLPGFKEKVRFSRRALDPAPFFLDFKTDTNLPSLEECKKRAGLINTNVKHEALADAFDVVELLRKKY